MRGLLQICLSDDKDPRVNNWQNGVSAGMSSAQVAQAVGVRPSAVSRTERRADKAMIETLARYARACGIEHPPILI